MLRFRWTFLNWRRNARTRWSKVAPPFAHPSFLHDQSGAQPGGPYKKWGGACLCHCLCFCICVCSRPDLVCHFSCDALPMPPRHNLNPVSSVSRPPPIMNIGHRFGFPSIAGRLLFFSIRIRTSVVRASPIANHEYWSPFRFALNRREAVCLSALPHVCCFRCLAHRPS